LDGPWDRGNPSPRISGARERWGGGGRGWSELVVGPGNRREGSAAGTARSCNFAEGGISAAGLPGSLGTEDRPPRSVWSSEPPRPPRSAARWESVTANRRGRGGRAGKRKACGAVLDHVCGMIGSEPVTLGLRSESLTRSAWPARRFDHRFWAKKLSKSGDSSVFEPQE
jgi:hypothetical protein